MATNLHLRPGRPEDARILGGICFAAFRNIAERHGFPPDFPSVDVAAELMSSLLTHPQIYSVVGEQDGQITGSNFLWEQSSIAGVGPITVATDVQNTGVGRTLMNDVLDRAHSRRVAGVRLVQAAYHQRSMSLYAKLGFEVREPLATMQGAALGLSVRGAPVRPARTEDIPACNRVAMEIHGHERANELLDAVRRGTASVVERNGRITGYTTSIGFFGHAVAETNDDLKALIGAAPAFEGPGFLLPTRNSELLRWCLANRLRMVQPMTLMSMGRYDEPAGPFLPSVLF